MIDTLFSGAFVPGLGQTDIAVSAGRISGLGAISEPAAVTIDCRGLLCSPGLVEGHIHLDKTLLGLPFIPHLPGASVAERIAREKELRRSLPLGVVERGGALIRQIVASGTVSIRSHVDIDTEIGLGQLHALLELKARYAHLVDIQIVAFPQSGILRDPGTADLLDAALSEGADLIGGLDPAGIDADIGGHLSTVFRLAEKHDAGVDIHLHDGGLLGLFELRDIAARTRATGLMGRVAVSHAFSLGEALPIEETADALAAANVAIMTNGPGNVPMPPILRLRQLGVTVFAGSDNIRDAWSPYGNGDLLDRAALIGYRQGMNADPEIEHLFDMVTTIPARVLGLADYGLAVGDRADLVFVRAQSRPEAVAAHPVRALVVKSGVIVARDGHLVA